jgi:hypothetical protein
MKQKSKQCKRSIKKTKKPPSCQGGFDGGEQVDCQMHVIIMHNPDDYLMCYKILNKNFDLV